VEYLKPVDEIVNLPHETFHKNDFRQTDAHVLQFRGKRLHLREIVQLHGS
jgi:hypothetical protein